VIDLFVGKRLVACLTHHCAGLNVPIVHGHRHLTTNRAAEHEEISISTRISRILANEKSVFKN
jgi:hypothetical protein